MPKDGKYSYCFTCNNYTDLDIKQLKELTYTYLVYGHEIAPTTGTPHLQGYVHFASQRTMKALSKKCPRVAWKECDGTAQQNRTYIIGPYNNESLDKHKPYNPEHFENGECPQMGKRTDLDNVRELIKEGKGMKDVVMVATSYQSVKMAECILKYHEKKRDWKPKVYWFYGGAGTGKSKLAYEMFPSAYTAMATAKWWDGYDAHEDIIIDDMRKDFCKFHELLRILDRFPVQLETKGGTRQLLARNIVITSCYSPEQLFETREDLKQLTRRIDEIKFFELNILEKN